MMNDFLSVHIGWSEVDEEAASNVDPKLNFHLTYLHSAGSPPSTWYSVLTLSQLTELDANITSYTEEVVFSNAFPKLSGERLISLLTSPPTAARPHTQDLNALLPNLTELIQPLRTLQNWILEVLLSLPYLDRESQLICKQYFFKDITRISLFEHLYKRLSKMQLANSTNDSVSSHRDGKAPKKKMFSYLFSSSSAANPTPAPVAPLSSKNLNSKSSTASTFSLFTRKARSVVSESEGAGDGDGVKSALDIAQRSVLTRVEVCRGHEGKQGVLMYQITLRATGKAIKNPIVYTVHQRYNAFKKLQSTLMALNDELRGEGGGSKGVYYNFMLMLKEPFPSAPMKCYFGIALNDSDLSLRTRLLDAWFRDVCAHYRDFPSRAREEVRRFLELDMQKKKDQFFQDQLVWGTLEDNGGNTVSSAPHHTSPLEADPAPNQISSYSFNRMADPHDHPATSALLSAAAGGGGGGGGGNGNKKNLETASVRSYKPAASGSGAPLSSQIWETASQGGVSKMHKSQAKKSRGVFLSKKQETIMEADED